MAIVLTGMLKDTSSGQKEREQRERKMVVKKKRGKGINSLNPMLRQRASNY